MRNKNKKNQKIQKMTAEIQEWKRKYFSLREQYLELKDNSPRWKSYMKNFCEKLYSER